MAVQRDRPYGNFNFLVDLGTGDTGSVRAGFAEVIFPEASIDVVEYRNGNERDSAPRKITLGQRYTNLVLKRGVIGSLDLYDWWNSVRNGGLSDLRTVVITLQSEDQSNAVLTWILHRARPVKLKFSNLEAKGKDILVEYLELAFEHLEMQ